jgi:hypothetical protein
MTLKDYLKQATTEERRSLWNNDPSRRQHIYGISSGRRRPSAQMAREIERLTGGMVTRADLRPDIWGD